MLKRILQVAILLITWDLLQSFVFLRTKIPFLTWAFLSCHNLEFLVNQSLSDVYERWQYLVALPILLLRLLSQINWFPEKWRFLFPRFFLFRQYDAIFCLLNRMMLFCQFFMTQLCNPKVG